MTCPTGKLEYASSGAASQAFGRISKRRECPPYHCPVCGNWHLGRTNAPARSAHAIFNRAKDRSKR